jgi:hypothetical protein
LYYQADHWKDAQEAYSDALAVYQRLLSTTKSSTSNSDDDINDHDDHDHLLDDVLRQELWSVYADIKELEKGTQLQDRQDGCYASSSSSSFSSSEASSSSTSVGRRRCHEDSPDQQVRFQK